MLTDPRQGDAQMAGLVTKKFDSPDEQRRPDKKTLDLVNLDGVKAARLTWQAGWRCSECIKRVVGGDSCKAHHVGTIASGVMHVGHDDGTSGDIGPGEAYVIQPGHDAWVVGDEPVVGFEFDSSTAQTYASGS